jgi:glutamyl-tRNA reductase
MSGDELRAYGDQVVDRLLRENENRWRSLQPGDRVLVEQLAHEVATRLLEEPARRMERVPAAQARALADLFARPQSASVLRRTRVSS